MTCITDPLDRQVRERPEGLALSDTLGEAWDFATVAAKSAAVVEELRALGVRENDRVLLVLENCAAAVAVIFACARLGAAVIPFNARQTKDELARVMAHADPAAVLFTSDVSPEAAKHADAYGAEELGALDGLRATAFTSAPEDVLQDVAVILYTTGTTGAPKGVMLTHDNLCFGGNATCVTRDVGPDDVIYGVLPISHVFGLTSIIMAAVMGGAHVRLAPRFTPQGLYEALTSGVTLLSAVPQMHALLMQYTKTQGFDRLPTDTLRYVSSGAAPLDPDWKRRAEAFFGIPLQNGYGMTETTAGVCLTRQTASNDDISVGRPFPGVEVRLDHTAPNAQGDVGEILVGGGGVMKGYFRNPDETASAFTEDGWLRTGDLGRFDEDGNLHIAGRAKELIIHGGFNVYPPEVEAALNDHAQVIQSAVVGHTVNGDELVCAFVEAQPDTPLTEAELRAFVAERLAGYKRPSRIIFLDKLPAAPTGKILKHKLKELL